MKAYKIIPYIARTFTVLTLAFVLLFVAAHVFGAEETGDLNLISRKDKVTFFFFPVIGNPLFSGSENAFLRKRFLEKRCIVKLKVASRKQLINRRMEKHYS